MATVAAKVGLARARYGSAALQLEEAELCTRLSPGETIAAWLRNVRGLVLLAIEAPLGWPAPLAQSLAAHRACASRP